MNVVYECVECIASFIEIFILYRIYNVLFGDLRKKRGKKEEIVFTLGAVVIVFFCNRVALFSYFTLLFGVLYMSFSALYIYKIKYIVSFSVSSFYFLCMAYVDSLYVTTVAALFGGQETFIYLTSQKSMQRMWMICVGRILWILLYLGMKKIIKKITLKHNYTRKFIVVSCVGTCGFVFLTEQTWKGFGKSITGVWFLGVVFIASFLFGLYFVTENKEQKMNLKITQTRNQLLEENYQALNDIYTSNAKLYHDLNNHLNVLYQFLEEGETEEAKEYIREISQPIQKLTKTVWTGVDVVDVIISSKVEKMRNKGISWDINAEFPKNTNIQPYDLCTILSNLLDNAVEAVERTGRKGNISLTIRKINYFLMIRIANSCIGKNNSFDALPKTTKEDKTMHGWGLQNVQQTVQKYGGTLKFRQEENQFIVDVMMFFEGETEREKE
ncbi:MAG: GHKL domain-containing protein [Oliverpabstia sp.]|nr:GHKL domain-containing protein [Oliverpabstia sp.]